VDNRRTDIVMFSPLTDVNYAATFTGKKWFSEVTLDDQIAAAQHAGYVPAFVNTGQGHPLNPALIDLVKSVEIEKKDHERVYEATLCTDVGSISQRTFERPYGEFGGERDWIRTEDELDIADWITKDVLSGRRDGLIRQYYGNFVQKIQPYGVSQIQLELPYFLYCLPGLSAGPLMMCLDKQSRYYTSMEMAADALEHIAEILIEVGVDFIWIGAGGTELLSPSIYEEVIIPQSRRIIKFVKSKGGRIHYHCCGKSQLWVDNGYFNKIGMDVLETLSAPPSGSIEDIGKARARIDKTIVTRGNIDLELIRNGNSKDCAKAARAVIEATSGYPHIIGAGDAILYGTPAENLVAIKEECEK
jgi:hypothetical protein